jgi:hypothetical protein
MQLNPQHHPEARAMIGAELSVWQVGARPLDKEEDATTRDTAHMLVEVCWHMISKNFGAVGPKIWFSDSQSQYWPGSDKPPDDNEDNKVRHLDLWYQLLSIPTGLLGSYPVTGLQLSTSIWHLCPI